MAFYDSTELRAEDAVGSKDHEMQPAGRHKRAFESTANKLQSAPPSNDLSQVKTAEIISLRSLDVKDDGVAHQTATAKSHSTVSKKAVSS